MLILLAQKLQFLSIVFDLIYIVMSRIFIIAGEESGDLRGAKLCEALYERKESLKISGAGGTNMKEAGVDLVYPLAESAVVGISEAITKLPKFSGEFRKVRRELMEFDPDLVVLVDFPDFNLHMARYIQEQDIPIVYYISPQVWAWRNGRVKTIKKYVDLMLVLFDFEQEIYQQAGVPVEYVGHPLVEEMEETGAGGQVRQAIGATDEQFLIGVLPGSRDGEFQTHYPPLQEAARTLIDQDLGDAILVPVSTGIQRSTLRKYKGRCGGREFWFREHSRDVIAACDLILTASGTTTLEALLLETPMVVCYKVNWFSWMLGKMFVDMDSIAMCNIIAGERIVPECIQWDCTPETISETATSLIQETGLDNVRNRLKKTREQLGPPGASNRAATEILNVLNS